MSSEPDYYLILNVPVTASAEDIKVAYRRQVKIHHPDRYPLCSQKTQATLKVRRIIEAYSVLHNPEDRRRYDEGRRQSLRASGAVSKKGSESGQPPAASNRTEDSFDDVPPIFRWTAAAAWIACSGFMLINVFFIDGFSSVRKEHRFTGSQVVDAPLVFLLTLFSVAIAGVVPFAWIVVGVRIIIRTSKALGKRIGWEKWPALWVLAIEIIILMLALIACAASLIGVMSRVARVLLGLLGVAAVLLVLPEVLAGVRYVFLNRKMALAMSSLRIDTN